MSEIRSGPCQDVRLRTMELGQEERDDKREEAFSLMEACDYEGVLALCRKHRTGGDDPGLAALEAAALYHLGRFQEAISHLRDLEGRTGASAATVLWLARCLEKTGDPDAGREYTRAVLLDPGNERAVTLFMEYRLSHGDTRGAAALARFLPGGPGRDVAVRIMEGLTGAGDPEGAIAVYNLTSQAIGDCHEYILALSAAGRYDEAAREASSAYARTGDRWYRSASIAARVPADPGRAVTEFSHALSQDDDVSFKAGYIRALCAAGEFQAARNCYNEWFRASTGRACRVLCAMVTFGTGDPAGGASILEEVLCDAVLSGDPPAEVLSLFSEYASLLVTYMPSAEASGRVRRFALSREEPVIRVAAGEVFSFLGDRKQAGEFLEDAYRRDFFEGGLSYARFLQKSGDIREAEKVLLYIARNVRRLPDLQRVACAASSQADALPGMRRLTRYLIMRLGAGVSHLSYEGLEVYAVLLLQEAGTLFKAADLPGCKRLCLLGLDAVPPHSDVVNPGDFTTLLIRCKERMPADNPTFSCREPVIPEDGVAQEKSLIDLGVLTREEEIILDFMRTHGRAHERELRELTGSRRVTGQVGQIIRKAREHGIILIEREGMSENGEIYTYVGP